MCSTEDIKINSMNNLKYRIAKKEETFHEKTAILEPEALKYLIKRGNEKRESMLHGKKRFNLNQEILLRNAQLHAENDLHKLNDDKLEKAAGNGSSPHQRRQQQVRQLRRVQRHRRRHSIQLYDLPYIYPTLSSAEMDSQIPDKTFERPSKYKLLPRSPLITSPKKRTNSMKLRMINSKSTKKIGKILQKMWSYLLEALSYSNITEV